MGNKTIGAGANIDMALGLGFVNPAGHNQVLPEVFAFGDAGFGVAVVEAGVEGHPTLMACSESAAVSPVLGEAAECAQ